jgi:hypothetical protein
LATTVAVSVTTLGVATVVTGLPAEVTARVVVVGVAAWANCPPAHRVTNRIASSRPVRFRFTAAERDLLAQATRQLKMKLKVFIGNGSFAG